jgi:hypothetical protein
MTTERRVDPRAKIVVDVQFELDDGALQDGRVENVSTGGMLLISPGRLSVGERVRIVFTDSPTHQTYSIRGDIVRSASAGKHGVAFVHADEKVLGYLRELIETG